ncbi:hypothetical protein BSL78_17160 [Apostichopus japonicus]|uniref:Uncharacterized protein n=1 Tax=Stichopus japonicus TaxID=307972 RepID=A0A2G8KDA0_STIJA|nr:hypothetical protein BSL78_17160 [Apostichopus japonicus]
MLVHRQSCSLGSGKLVHILLTVRLQIQKRLRPKLQMLVHRQSCSLGMDKLVHILLDSETTDSKRLRPKLQIWSTESCSLGSGQAGHILLDSETTDSKATSAQVADVGPQAKLLSRQWDKLVHILLDSETTDSKATSAQVADVGPQAKLLSRQWDKLVLRNGVLFRRIQDTVSSISTYSAQCHRATAFKGLHSDVGHVWTDSTGPKCSCLLGTNAVLVRRVFEGRPRLQRQQGELQSLQGDRWSYFV